MLNSYVTLLVKINVINYAQILLKNADKPDLTNLDENSLSQPLLYEDSNRTKLDYLGGTILKEDLHRFRKLLFRASRGKVFAQFYPLEIKAEDKIEGINEDQHKIIYVVMFQQGKFTSDKIKKLCASFQEPM